MTDKAIVRQVYSFRLAFYVVLAMAVSVFGLTTSSAYVYQYFFVDKKFSNAHAEWVESTRSIKYYNLFMQSIFNPPSNAGKLGTQCTAFVYATHEAFVKRSLNTDYCRRSLQDGSRRFQSCGFLSTYHYPCPELYLSGIVNEHHSLPYGFERWVYRVETQGISSVLKQVPPEPLLSDSEFVIYNVMDRWFPWHRVLMIWAVFSLVALFVCKRFGYLTKEKVVKENVFWKVGYYVLLWPVLLIKFIITLPARLFRKWRRLLEFARHPYRNELRRARENMKQLISVGADQSEIQRAQQIVRQWESRSEGELTDNARERRLRAVRESMTQQEIMLAALDDPIGTLARGIESKKK